MKSRSQKAIFSLLTGLIGEIVLILTNLISRKVLCDVLGTEYLGISSLFTSILSMLSLVELGVGTSIIYHMYKPVAEDNKIRIYQLLMFFRKAYHIIGIVISAVGLIILPMLSFLIDDVPGDVNVYILFLIYLLQTIASYFFRGYKSALLQANQKQYSINIVTLVSSVVTSLSQIAVLIIFKNIYFYIGVRALTTILQNLLVAWWCDKSYPEILKLKGETLPKEDQRSILKDCYALLIYRINGVMLYSVDGLIITKVLGLVVNGIYSNYSWISTTIKNFTKLLFKSVENGVGNKHASVKTADIDSDKTLSEEFSVFRCLNLLSVIINGVALTGIVNVADIFIATYFGKDMTISLMAVILLALDVYISGIASLISTYRKAYGLFQQAKYRPIASTVSNLVISLLLVKPLGLVGILIGTVVSVFGTTVMYDSYIVYKCAFKKKAFVFHRTNTLYLVITAAGCTFTCVTSVYGFGFITNAWVQIIIRTALSVIIPLAVYFITLGRTKEFARLLTYVKNILKRGE